MPQWSPKAEEVDTRSAWEKRTSGIQGHFAELEEESSIPDFADAPESKRTDSVVPTGYVGDLESLLYACIVELEYVQSVENCRSGLCASTSGKNLVEQGMKLLQLNDLYKEPSV